MNEDTIAVVELAKVALQRGVKRDDVYHEVVRHAAQNGLDRYELWHDVVSGPNDPAYTRLGLGGL